VSLRPGGVGKNEPVPLGDLADDHVQAGGQSGSVDDEGVELPALTAGVHPGRKPPQQFLVIPAASELSGRLGRVDVGDDLAQTLREVVGGEVDGGSAPRRKQWRDARAF